MDFIFEISATNLVENTSQHSWDNFIVGFCYHILEVNLQLMEFSNFCNVINLDLDITNKVQFLPILAMI